MKTYLLMFLDDLLVQEFFSEVWNGFLQVVQTSGCDVITWTRTRGLKIGDNFSLNFKLKRKYYSLLKSFLNQPYILFCHRLYSTPLK